MQTRSTTSICVAYANGQGVRQDQTRRKLAAEKGMQMNLQNLPYCNTSLFNHLFTVGTKVKLAGLKVHTPLAGSKSTVRVQEL